MYDNAYMVGVVYLFVLLLFPSLLHKNRSFMIWSGLIWAPAAPILEYWHHQDYWSPVYLLPVQIGAWRFGVEDYLFGLVFAGICSGLFNRFADGLGPKTGGKFRPSGLVVLLVFSVVGGPMGMFILSTLLGINSIYAIGVMELSLAVIICFRRPDWITAALRTAVLIGVGFWASYYLFYLKLFPGIIHQWWHKDILAGASLVGIPWEEVMWAMMSGLCIGPVSRFFLITDR